MIFLIIVYIIFQSFCLFPLLNKLFKDKLQRDLCGFVQFCIVIFIGFWISFFAGIGNEKAYCGVTYDYNWDNDYNCIPYTEEEIFHNRISDSLQFSIGMMIVSVILHAIVDFILVEYKYKKDKLKEK